MATTEKVIRNNHSILPFLGERMSFIRGLDPLGLQNTSDATFSILLPGLNNVTGRIRYYSFYCWLLDQYSKRVGSTDPELQRAFIRKAEYTIALCSPFFEGGNGSIPGSLYASAEIQNPRQSSYDLIAGTSNPDGSSSNTYWSFRWGAYGQYYFGSLKEIGLALDREDNFPVYRRSPSRQDEYISGEMLAKAFDENIPAEKKELFFTCLEESSITETQLIELLPEFNLAKVPVGTAEQLLLTHLLIQKDHPARIEEEPRALRKRTIYHLLKYATSDPEYFEARTFVYSAYRSKGRVGEFKDESLFGWYFYQFNEFWHFANTTLLNGTLDYLESNWGPNWVQLSQFVTSLANQIFERLRQEGLVDDNGTVLEQLLDRQKGDEFKYHAEYGKTTETDRVLSGFKLMFAIYKHNIDELADLKEFGENHDVSKDGEGSGYFLLEFKAKLNMQVLAFIREYLFKHIIYRHQYVALRKIRGGGFSTQKFIIEDHHIRYLGNFDASYTGPRIGNLIAFLNDLKIVDKTNKLTEYGTQILNQITPQHD